MRASLTTKPQQVPASGGIHLRPDGRECQYASRPPLCMRCGALLDPKPHAIDCDLDEDYTCGAS